MDNNMYSYFDPADLQDAHVASGSSYDPQTVYMHSARIPMPNRQSPYLAEPQLDPQSSYIHESDSQSFSICEPDSQSSYSREPRSGPQSSYFRNPQPDSQSSFVLESLPSSHHPYPTSRTHMPHASTSSSSSSSANVGSSHRRRNSSPNSPLSPDVPLPPLRTRRSPGQRFLALPDDAESSDDEPLPPNATESERAEWRRRRNTKAARRSRRRRLQHTEQLQANVDRLQQEVLLWRTRAWTLCETLKSLNQVTPDYFGAEN